MGFESIPVELRLLNQWVCWRYEQIEFTHKPTKVPYNPLTGFKASVIDASSWAAFDSVIAAVAAKQYDGIGFVLTESDKFAIIDLDDTQGNAEIVARQKLIHDQFDTYSEHSPSGIGLHLIIEANIPQGRKRGQVEIYSSKRFMTVTGNIYNNKPIARRQEIATILFDEMSRSHGMLVNFEGEPERDSDDDILMQGASAPLNGDRFKALYEGRWKELGNYPSQSEADFAFIDMLANYTKNKIQVKRIFHKSWLGARPKAHRENYINPMVDRAFDRVIGPIDFSKFDKDKFKEKAPTFIGASSEVQVGLSDREESHSDSASVAPKPKGVKRPPGLMGELADFVYWQSHRPVQEIALCAAIALVAGIVGRQFNTPTGAGLNLYTVLVAQTAVGKEAMALGISKLVSSVKKHVPAIDQFMGPAELASGPALLRKLEKQNCCLSIITEFGHMVHNMCSERAPPHLVTLRRVLLDVYTKSGRGAIIRPMAYSDRDKDILDIHEPAYTLLAESTPSTLYENLDERLIAMGLISRLFIIEYHGDRVAANKNLQFIPSDKLIVNLGSLASYCLLNAKNNVVIDVQWSTEGKELSEKFDLHCDGKIRDNQSGAIRDLYGRANLTVMKLASLFAVSENYFHPIITPNNWEMAQELVSRAIENISWKFAHNEMGRKSDEPEQTELIKRAIDTYIKRYLIPKKLNGTYRITAQMLEDGIITYKYLHDNLVTKPAFQPAFGLKGVAALQVALKVAQARGLIAEVKETKRLSVYHTEAILYQIRELPE